jgi:quercetin dioxygenase-like cupin family protein
MKRWHLPSITASSEKRTAREPGADAPRAPSVGRQKPRVLFSSPECRFVVLDLLRGDGIGDHRVRERAVVQVISGRVSVEAAGETVECDAGTLMTFDPGEPHAVRSLDDARLLLVLAPWPAPGHNAATEMPHGQHLPANASVGPIESLSTPARDAPAGSTTPRRRTPQPPEH